MANQESSNALLARFIRAISEVDLSALVNLSTQDIRISIPGARDVDLTMKSTGVDSLCAWAKAVHDECGHTTFRLHRYFENGCEMMAVGKSKLSVFLAVLPLPVQSTLSSKEVW